ncbi:GGDEF domain-containing protein [Dokdonella sp.]|uniref:GGDEF domain-containing protein n=1 Tax=Dokdonella sp. TaxID=2291710 RepID=UPI002CA53FF2|nr:GGDEF domain-containing protein [Dokdonella sp.]HPN77951.1 GGDEF domain-containing protein [Dokdonella sp.]
MRGLAMACALLGMPAGHCWAMTASTSNEALVEQLHALQGNAPASTGAAAQLARIEASIPDDAPYPLQRELAQARMSVLGGNQSVDQRLAAMKALRDLAEAHGDVDTVSLMDIRRIYMSHADDDIGKFIDQLNGVRAHIRSDASPEVMEALELSYGNMYFDAGNFDTALRHQLAALDWAGKLPSGSESARLFRLSTIADLYNAMELPDPALEYVDRAFALPVDPFPVQNRISLLSTRAIALLKKRRLIESDNALREAEGLLDGEQPAFTTLRVGAARAEWLLAMEKSQQAIAAIDRIEALATQREDSYYLARARMLRGHALMQLDQVDAGLALMQSSTEHFIDTGQMVDVLDGLDRQIRTLRDKKLFGRAVEVMERRQRLWSQLFRNERGRAIAEAEARHTAQDLEHRISALSIENRVQQQRLRAERMGKALALVLALFAISVSAMLYVAIRRARKERDRLSDVVRFDALTGASSRYQFQRRRVHAPPQGDTGTSLTGLLLLDLDHFKAINDQHGHEAGDAVLKTVVERIRRVLDRTDELYRWGGEEFLVILNHRDSSTTLERDVRGLLAGIEGAPVPWHGQSIPVSVSGGYVQHPLAQGWRAPLSDAIRWADAALYLAKNTGRRRVEHVEIRETGRIELIGRRPIDMPQLLDWQRRGYLRMRTLIAENRNSAAS